MVTSQYASMESDHQLSLSSGIIHKPQILLRKVVHSEKISQARRDEDNLSWTLVKILKIAAWSFRSCFLALEHLPYHNARIQKCGLTLLKSATDYCMNVAQFCPANFILMMYVYCKSNYISSPARLYFNSGKVNFLMAWNHLGILWRNKYHWNASL